MSCRIRGSWILNRYRLKPAAVNDLRGNASKISKNRYCHKNLRRRCIRFTMSKINYLVRSIVLCMLFCLLGQALAAQGIAPKNGDNGKTETEKWREDLRYMAGQMPLFHKDLFHRMTREQFDTAVKKLYDRIPVLARHQIIVEMQRIVAMAGDGHTNIYPTRDPKIGFHVFPVKMYFFQDGLFVRSLNAAAKEHTDLVGAKIIKIGNATALQAYAAVREIIGRDNEMDAKFFAAHLLVMPEVLHALGLSDNAESARFTFETKSGQKIVELRAAGAVEMMPARHGYELASKNQLDGQPGQRGHISFCRSSMVKRSAE